MTDPDSAVHLDFGRLSTDQLGRIYVHLLRKGGIQDAAIQREWTRRSKAERLTALRRCRDETATDPASLFTFHVGP